MVLITKGFAMIVCVSVFVCLGNVQLNQCGPHKQGFCHGFVCLSVSECVMCMDNVQLKQYGPHNQGVCHDCVCLCLCV